MEGCGKRIKAGFGFVDVSEIQLEDSGACPGFRCSVISRLLGCLGGLCMDDKFRSHQARTSLIWVQWKGGWLMSEAVRKWEIACYCKVG